MFPAFCMTSYSAVGLRPSLRQGGSRSPAMGSSGGPGECDRKASRAGVGRHLRRQGGIDGGSGERGPELQ